MTDARAIRRDPARFDLSSLAWSTTDRAMAIAAHGAIAFGLLGIGFVLSAAIAGVIWLVSRRRPHVAFHGEQAGIYQLAVLVINAAVITLWLAVGVTMFGQRQLIPGLAPVAQGEPVAPWLITLWLLAVPVFGIWWIGTIAYGIYGAVQVALGRRFWYPMIGPWAYRRAMRGQSSVASR